MIYKTLSLRLFNRAIWSFFLTSNEVLEAVRTIELMIIALRFLLIRAPLLIVWTRLPGLKEINPPYYDQLVEVLKPQERPLLTMWDIRDPSLGDVKSKEELADFIRTAKRRALVPRPFRETVAGSVLAGLLLELGPAFIKLSYIWSMSQAIRPGIRERLRLMQRNIPPMKPKDFKKALEREMNELGFTVEEEFEWVEAHPLANGSLSEICRAKLRSGENVAIKLQRPYMEAITMLDTMVVRRAGSLIWRVFHGVRKNDPRLFGDCFSETLRWEQDFFLEGRMSELLQSHVVKDPLYSQLVKIPKVYSEYCTVKLMVMELVENYHDIDHILEMGPENVWDVLSTKLPQYSEEEPLQLFRALASLWGDALVSWGYMHADLRPGNVFLLEPQDGCGWRIFLCDFALTEEMPEYLRIWMVDWLRAVLWLADAEEFTRVALRFVPRDELEKIHRDFPCLVNRRYCAEATEKVRSIILAPHVDPYIANIRNYLVIRHTETTGDSGEAVFPITWMGGRSAGAEAWDLIQRLSIPLKVNELVTSDHWILFNSLTYVEGILATLWLRASWEDIFGHSVRRELRREIEDAMRYMPVTEFKDYIKDVTDLVQRPKYHSILRENARIEPPPSRPVST